MNQRSQGLLKEVRYVYKHRELLLLAAPGVLFKLVFSYLPLLGLIVAFKKFRYDQGIFGSEWIGFKNFEFFFQSEAAWTITRNTVLYNVGFMIITTMSALALAVLLNEVTSRALKVYQTALFLPYFFSWVVVGYIAIAFLDHERGYLNQLLSYMQQAPVKWYNEPVHWPYLLNIAHLWKVVGFSTLVYFAGIIGIDPTYYEAARIDGATKWQMVRTITLPLLTPLIVILLIVETGKIFRADFGLFYFIPNDSSFLFAVTDVIDTYVYRSLRVVGDIGMSTAIGLYQSFVGFILVMTANFVVRKINRDNAIW